MTTALLSRVRFRERQPLTAADLDAEQAHRLALRRRHNAGQHGWGIAAGLALRGEPGGGLLVDPGLALDGFGRELVLPAPVRIDRAALEQAAGGPTGRLAVVLLYGREPAGRDRWREACRLRLTAVGADPIDFDPSRTPPDDPQSEWPVPLGIVMLRTASLSVLRANRVYARLVGEEVRDPAGRVRLAFARVQGRERLGVSVRSIGGGGGDLVERLAVERLPEPAAWQATVRGPARTGSSVRLEPPPDSGPGGVRFGTPIPRPQEASPWRIYRVAADPEGSHPGELRFEIGDPGEKGDPATRKLIVGDVVEKGEIVPWLSVTAGRTVRVHGDLVVEGQLLRSPLPANPDDPAFASAVAGAWVKGIKAALSQDVGFGVGISAPGNFVEVNRPVVYTLTITNTGHAELVKFSCVEEIRIGTTSTRQSFVETHTVPAGGSHRFDHTSLSFRRTGDAVLTLNVQATGSAGNTLQRAVSMNFTVIPVIG
jgi:hypothetical protein